MLKRQPQCIKLHGRPLETRWETLWWGGSKISSRGYGSGSVGGFCSFSSPQLSFIPCSVNEALQLQKKNDATECGLVRGVDRTHPASKALTQGGGTKRTADRRYDSFSPRPPAKERREKSIQTPWEKVTYMTQHRADYSLKDNNQWCSLTYTTSQQFGHTRWI